MHSGPYGKRPPNIGERRAPIVAGSCVRKGLFVEYMSRCRHCVLDRMFCVVLGLSGGCISILSAVRQLRTDVSP